MKGLKSVGCEAALLLAALLACKGNCEKAGATSSPPASAEVAAVGPELAKPTAADDFMGGIHEKVANDAVAQYELTKKHGSKMEVCVHAGMVSAAYLQAKNEAKYAEWKAIEKADCKKAGLPQ